VKNPIQDFLVIKETRNHHLVSTLINLFQDIKIIYIVRNPCGAINSWLSSPKEFPITANPYEEWKSGKCRKTGEGEYWGFDDWKLLTAQYLDFEERYPDNVKVISYEDLVRHSHDVTQEMFEFAGMEFSEEAKKFLNFSQSTHSDHTRAVFKSKDVKDRWKLQLAPEIIDAIRKELNGSDLEKYLDK
jgi:hypothetical protein